MCDARHGRARRSVAWTVRKRWAAAPRSAISTTAVTCRVPTACLLRGLAHGRLVVSRSRSAQPLLDRNVWVLQLSLRYRASPPSAGSRFGECAGSDDLDHRRSGSAERVEGDVLGELDPDVVAKVGLDGAFNPRQSSRRSPLQRCEISPTVRRWKAVPSAADHSWRLDRRRRIDHAADSPLR